MGEKDITEKTLEAYNDVFADIVNVLLFHGEQVVREDELEEDAPRSHYKAEGKIHEMERDVAKFWKKQNVRIAFYGLENQTDPDRYMPPRVIGYDGTAYRSQLLDVDGKGRPKGVYPVVTLVLYFGTEHWKYPLTLFESMDIPEKLRPFVNDYRVNLFEIAYLTDERAAMFRSDFRYVADYFIQKRKDASYIPAPGRVKHIHETLELLNALTGDERFGDACRSLKGDEKTMREAMLDRMEEEFMEKGREQGLEQGLEQGERQAISLIKILMDNNRFEDLKRITEDEAYWKKLSRELLASDDV